MQNFEQFENRIFQWRNHKAFSEKNKLLIFVPHREIEGKVYVGEVKEKEKAKKQYEKAVSAGKTAGLVKWDWKIILICGL